MARKFDGGRLVIASHNQGKVREIADLLAPYGTEVVLTAGKLNLDEPEETGTTFMANAEIKALAAARHGREASRAGRRFGACGAYAGGRDPGIYSARWAGPAKDFSIAMRKVEDALAGKADRSAHFACALVLAWPDGIVSDSKAGWTARWSGRRAARTDSATTRCSKPTGMPSPSARWTPTPSTPSAIGPTPSASWSRPASRNSARTSFSVTPAKAGVHRRHGFPLSRE